jgi:diketogulonate reductase-like aldo/keto reductase
MTPAGDGGMLDGGVEHIARLIAETGVAPAINQIEYHPYFQQPAASAFHLEQGIVTVAWSPLARGGELLRDGLDNEAMEALNALDEGARLGPDPATFGD